MATNSELLQEYNDRLAQLYDEATTKTESSWTAPKEITGLVLEYIHLNTKVLDIGIGTGQSAELLEQSGAVITGIDLSQEMLKRAKEKHSSWELHQIDISNGFLESQEVFDIAVASGVLEFVEDIGAVLSNVHSVLKPGGYFCFTYEEYLPEYPLQKDKSSKLGKGLKDPIPESVSFMVYRRYPDEINGMITATSFKELKGHQFISYYKADGKYPVIYRVVLAQKA